jgi:acyl phosphate:glycerol-3-phosphate acyltransferase
VAATFASIAVIAYLLGSIPAGYIAGRIAGLDIRKVGSGNVGATNVTRVLGKRFGYPVFLVDFGKGLVAVLIAVTISKGAKTNLTFVDLCAALAALFAVLGHSYSIWLGFGGGKGVATCLGALFGINWIAAGAVCVIWLVVFQVTRYVSLASVAAAIALPIAMTILFFAHELQSPTLVYLALCLGLFVVLRHRSNLSRLCKGTEPRFSPK